jgi:uncharacterized integral membrane protein
MLLLIFLLVFGTTVAFVALQNPTPVTLHIFTYTVADLPLFYVMVGAMLVGILLAYVLYLVRSISAALTIRDKDKKIKDDAKELTRLTKENHQLELENVRLKTEANPLIIDDRSL